MSTNGNGNSTASGGGAHDIPDDRRDYAAEGFNERLRSFEECVCNPLRAGEAILHFVALDMVATTGAPDADRAERWRWAVRSVSEVLSAICAKLYPSQEGGQAS